MPRFARLCLPLLLTCTVLANPAPAPTRPVTAIAAQQGLQRDPGFLPYAKTYEWLSRFQREAGPLRLEMRLLPARPDGNLVGVRLYLLGPTFQEAIPIGPHGEIDIPLRPAALADKAELHSNRAPGELVLLASFWLNLPQTELPATTLRAALNRSAAQLKSMTPWYQRAWMKLSNLFSQEEGAVFVLPTGARAELESAGRRTPLAVDPKNGRVVVIWRDEWLTQPTTLHFSAPPQRALPFFGRAPER
ncbi:hypothetical protein [Chitinimonas lacunae]|uniref:Uncharacterized protein n=1 Tax=Chitinimonas lacunae TaxID=1963018 RepID=A0ABV8MI15_9NEIS